MHTTRGKTWRPQGQAVEALASWCCGRLVGVLAVSLLTVPAAGWAQGAAAFFRQNCANCHTIGGGRLVGPDLKNVVNQRDRVWLVQFMKNPKAMIEGGDSLAVKLRDEARGVIMPTIPGMTTEMAEALLDLIAAGSALEVSQFKGREIPDAPFTPQDIALGEALFSGAKRFQGNSPACLACHTTVQVSGLGGGRLGPDLSRAFERLQGRKGLASWLSAPATPTMRAVFFQAPLRSEEILPLVAFLEASARQGADDERPQGLGLLLLALGGLAVCVVSFDAMWRGRLRSVRRTLVEGGRSRGGR